MKSRLINYAESAFQELDEIADWNEKIYGRSHARKYIAFLQHSIEILATRVEVGKQVNQRPGLHYIRVQRRHRGNGHVVVYRYDDATVHILHFFHTAQDWENKLGNAD